MKLTPIISAMLDAYTMPNARAFSGASFSMPNSAVIDGIRRKLNESVGAVKSSSSSDYRCQFQLPPNLGTNVKFALDNQKLCVGHQLVRSMTPCYGLSQLRADGQG